MPDRTVTVSIEPRQWKGSPIITWIIAAQAWVFALIALIVYLAGGSQ